MKSAAAKKFDTVFENESDTIKAVVVDNLGLVGTIAKSYANLAPLEDLVQEGAIGLLIAADRYDIERGVELSTYAAWWIRAYMVSFINKARGPVRVGTTYNTRKVLFGLPQARREFYARGVEPTREDLARRLGVEVEDVEVMLPRLAGSDVSLDAPVRDARHLSERLPDDAATPEESAAESEERTKVRQAIKRAMKKLSKKEREVIHLRFFAPEPWTLQRIGDQFGISRERVRQVELRAKKKLGNMLRDEAIIDEVVDEVEDQQPTDQG